MKTFTTEPFVDGYVFLEGPRWHADRLWVSDIWAQKVYGIEEDGRAEIAAEVPERPSGLGFLPDGTPLVVSMRDRRIYRIVSGNLELHADVSGSVKADINDMVVDRDGRAYVGGMGYDLFGGAESAPGEIVLIDPDDAHRVVADGLEFPNGMVITDGGGTLVVAESFGARLSAFDKADDGTLSGRRPYGWRAPWRENSCRLRRMVKSSHASTSNPTRQLPVSSAAATAVRSTASSTAAASRRLRAGAPARGLKQYGSMRQRLVLPESGTPCVLKPARSEADGSNMTTPAYWRSS